MLLPFLGAAATLAAAYGLGSAATRRSAGSAASLAAGAALLSLAIFVLMVTHMATTPALAAVVIAGALLFFLPPREQRPGLDAPLWFYAVLAPFAVYALVNAFAPEIEADANIYHLLPAVDAQTHHGFSRVIGFYERLPHATELLYVTAQGGARILHLAFLAATLPVIAALGQRLGLTRSAAWTASVMYGISPVVLVAASSAFNDATLVFATVTSIFVLVSGGPVWIAGLIAGFCFGVKMTGGITVAAGLVWLAWHRRWRDALVFGCVAALPMAPWLLRNLIEIHNPLAPFTNRLFPNPLFHISTEQQLGEALRSYGISFRERFPEVLWGWRLHGIIGPVFLLLPVVFLRRRNMWLLVFATVLSIPWWLNAGTRFLTPALPFLALAMVAALPARLIPVVLAFHAISCWPQVIERYSPKTWHLHEFPLRAALGFESHHDYLWRTSWDYHFAKLTESNTPPNARILDLQGIHRAHIRRDVIGWWHSAWSENAMRALEFARDPGESKLFEVHASFPKQFIRGIRIRPAQPSPSSPWSIVEIELRQGRDSVPTNPNWALNAKPNRWETPLAFDHNLATRWQSWQPTETRQWLAAEFAEPVELDNARIISTHWDAGNTRFDIDIQQPNGTWTAAATTTGEHGPLDLRQSATRYLKHLGFTHIAGRAGKEGTHLLMHALADRAPDWNLEVLAEEQAFYVLKLR
ncbi:MAG: glycosyltransferase 87 family protein [Bryobacteraceae bacterium]|nr:glycosyltransferase 87 family protein [Bryobacteraceae bacterium]